MSTLPRRFGDYMLMQRLARGGMGEIFLGQKPGARRYVALKTLRQDLTRDEEYVTRFLDEARVAIVLNHPAINKVFDVGFADDTYYLELEYISGRDVRSLTERARDLEKKIPEEVAYFIVTELLSALSYLHEAKDISGAKLNLIHRDVSPQNLMISWEGQVTMIDFGLARFAARTTATEPGMVLGKLRYMAPEQAQGGDIDHRVDLFAAGVMMYELLSGRRLYEDVDPNELWSIVAKGQALQGVHLDAVPAPAAPLIEHALAIDPAQRYASATDFLQQVQACQATPRAQAKRQLAEVLADLFEVDLQLEREFMDELGRMAPFEMHSGEMTQSVSLADPSATAPEETSLSDIAPDLVAAAAASAGGELSATDRNPFSDPVVTEDFEDEGVVSTPLHVDQAAAVTGEHTFLVDRSSESTAPDQTLSPGSPLSADSDAWFASAPEAAPGVLSPRASSAQRLRAVLVDWRFAAAAAGLGLALVGLVALLLGGENETQDKADAVAAPAALADPPQATTPRLVELGAAGSRSPVARPGAATKPSLAKGAHHQKARQTGAENPRGSVQRDRASSRRPRARSKNPAHDRATARRGHPTVKPTAPDSEPRPAQDSVDSAALQARTRRIGVAMEKALLREVSAKGLSRGDILAHWPQRWRTMRDASLTLAARQQAADEIKAAAATLVIDKTFIRLKLNRVQQQCNSILPRLDSSKQMVKDLRKQQAKVLDAYSQAGNDPAKLKQVNTLLNRLSLGVGLARSSS